MKCHDMWHAIMRLQEHHDSLAEYAVVWVSGMGCNVSDTLQKDKEDFIEQKSMIGAHIDRIKTFCDTNDVRAHVQNFGAVTTVAPTRTPFIERVLKEVKKQITECKHVLLVGESYGGLAVTYVADILADDPRAERLSVRTFGSTYVSAKFSNIVHFMFDDDVRATQFNGAKAPKGFGDVLFDPKTRIMWLRNYAVPEVRTIPYSLRPGSKSGRAYARIHKSYKGIFQVFGSEDIMLKKEVDPEMIEDTNRAFQEGEAVWNNMVAEGKPRY